MITGDMPAPLSDIEVVGFFFSDLEEQSCYQITLHYLPLNINGTLICEDLCSLLVARAAINVIDICGCSMAVF